MEKIEAIFEVIASFVSDVLGKGLTFAIAALLVILGLIFLDVNTLNMAISILTLMVLFALQNAQTKSDKAMHLKLDDLLLRLPEPDGDLAGIEDHPLVDVSQRRDEINKIVEKRKST